jgi:hypothetical protein
VHHALPTRHRENREFTAHERDQSLEGYDSRVVSPALLPSIRDLLQVDGCAGLFSENSRYSAFGDGQGLQLSTVLPPLQNQSLHTDNERKRTTTPSMVRVLSTACCLPNPTVSYHSPPPNMDKRSSSTYCHHDSPARWNGVPWPNTASADKHQITVDSVSTHNSLDQHILLCVIFFGWAATRSQFKLEKYWDGVQRIHEYYQWDTFDKMRVLSMMDYDLAVFKSRHKTGIESFPAWANPTYVVSRVLRFAFYVF